MNQELLQRVNGFDGDLAEARQFESSFANVFDLASAERLELSSQATALSLAEENAKLTHQNEALQHRIDRLTANRQRLHSLVAERTRELERVRVEAQSDPLTGLENRLRLIERLPVVLGRARSLGLEVGLIWLDVDCFSRCNQQLGEHCGDQVLQIVSRRIATHITDADSVSRAGDDEFVVVLPGLDREATRETMEKIIRLARAPCTIGHHTVSVQMSGGIAMYPDDANEASHLLRVAAGAMRRGKPSFLARRRRFFWPRKNADSPD